MTLLTTVTFAEADGQTRGRLEWVPLNATPEEAATFIAGMQGMEMGWGGSFDQLAENLRAA